jgi:hypothetical protein
MENCDGQGSIPCGSIMKVTLDETGITLADVAMQSYIDHKLSSNADIHVSNALVVDLLRATLYKMDPANRPDITWIFYGKEVHFDNNLRSNDAWNDPRTDIHSQALSDLLLRRMIA